MRAWLGHRCRKLASRLFAFGDWIEGCEVIYSRAFDLEPEHALKALEQAQANRLAEAEDEQHAHAEHLREAREDQEEKP